MGKKIVRKDVQRWMDRVEAQHPGLKLILDMGDGPTIRYAAVRAEEGADDTPFATVCLYDAYDGRKIKGQYSHPLHYKAGDVLSVCHTAHKPFRADQSIRDSIFKADPKGSQWLYDHWQAKGDPVYEAIRVAKETDKASTIEAVTKAVDTLATEGKAKAAEAKAKTLSWVDEQILATIDEKFEAKLAYLKTLKT